MKKIVSAPRLNNSSIQDTSRDSINYNQSRITDEPIKLGEYLKNRQQANKTAIIERIKSNPNLITYEDPLTKQTREKKESIMRNTDKLISLLTKKKTELDSKTLDELADHDQMIKQLLSIISPSQTSRVPQTTRKYANGMKFVAKSSQGTEQNKQTKANGFQSSLTSSKLSSSSYLNKTSYTTQTIKEAHKKFQKPSVGNMSQFSQQTSQKALSLNQSHFAASKIK